MGRKRDRGKQRKARQDSVATELYSSFYSDGDGCDLNHGVGDVPRSVAKFMHTFGQPVDEEGSQFGVGFRAFVRAKALHPNTLSNESHRDIIRKLLLAQGVSFLISGGKSDLFLADEYVAPIIDIEGGGPRAIRDVVQGGDRARVSFYHKRAPCSCLLKQWKQVKGTPKQGRCDGCQEYFERSSLMLCSECVLRQYCSVACQKEAWKTSHKDECREDFLLQARGVSGVAQRQAYSEGQQQK